MLWLDDIAEAERGCYMKNKYEVSGFDDSGNTFSLQFEGEDKAREVLAILKEEHSKDHRAFMLTDPYGTILECTTPISIVI